MHAEILLARSKVSDIEIVLEMYSDGQQEVHVHNAHSRLRTFNDLRKAETYVDVYVVVGGFTEDHTGDHGAPPAVAQADETAQMAYYAAQPTLTVDWVAAKYGVGRDSVIDAMDSVAAKADEIAAGTDYSR